MQRVVIALAIALETHKELDGDAVNEIYNQALLEPTP